MKVFLNNFENSSSSITKNQVATILNKTIEEAGFEQEEFVDKELSISCVSEKEIKLLNKNIEEQIKQPMFYLLASMNN